MTESTISNITDAKHFDEKKINNEQDVFTAKIYVYNK